MSELESRISLLTLGTQDLARAVTFYRESLGFTPREGDEGVAFFKLRGVWLALYPREELAKDAGVTLTAGGFSAFTLAYNVTTKEEVDAFLERAERAGGTLIKPGVVAFWGGYSGYFADPDGHLWEIATNPEML